MNILDNGKVAWVVVAVLAVVALLLATSSNKTVTRTFCAYNRVFVEFEENGHTWGTLLLDTDGRPIPCTDDTPTSVRPASKSINT